MNIIWILFIVIGIAYSFINGNINNVNSEIITSARKSLDIFLGIFPNIVLWSGIMKVATNSGLLNKVSNLIYPLLNKIFPDIPKGHESLSYISSNIASNILGLGSASTPFGLKAMESLQKLNNNKKTLSRSMRTFIILNVGGLCLIPTTIISLRSTYNSVNSTKVLLPIILTTLISTLIALFLDKLFKGEK